MTTLQTTLTTADCNSSHYLIEIERPAPIAPSRLFQRARISAIVLIDEMAQLDADERRSIVYGMLVPLLRGGMTASEVESLLAHAVQEVEG